MDFFVVFFFCLVFALPLCASVYMCLVDLFYALLPLLKHTNTESKLNTLL